MFTHFLCVPKGSATGGVVIFLNERGIANFLIFLVCLILSCVPFLCELMLENVHESAFYSLIIPMAMSHFSIFTSSNILM